MDTTQSDLPYWIAFASGRSIGARTIHQLAEYFGTLEAAWHADITELLDAGLPPVRAERLASERLTIDPFSVLASLERLHIQTVTPRDQAYPRLLKEIYDPPAVIFYRGTLPAHDALSVAIVGSRKTSPYGRRVTPQITQPLAAAGIVIVSGLALGIDALAHQAALDSQGITIGVLACGVDAPYPRANAGLAEAIITRGGAIISEFPPGTPPLKQHFPIRNRIIAGLAAAVVVIEGAEDSGSLITARCAADSNREVCAVPGSIESATARGPHRLLQMGAHLITSAADVCAILQLDNTQTTVQNRTILPSTEAERTVLASIETEPTDIDEIFQHSRLPSSIVNTALTTLEMKGLVRHEGGTRYSKTNT
ncbi:MAG: DNA-processing protein DprA [Patescibacteria group bacterium]